MSAPVELPLDLVVRFSTADPDIILKIAESTGTTGLSLKQRIRAELKAPASESRLRLIHAGKVLDDDAPLTRSLRGFLATPPPSASVESKSQSQSQKARGKQPLRDEDDSPALRARVYIHCSIGDILTAGELSLEARQATDSVAALRSDSVEPSRGLSTQAGKSSNVTVQTTMTPAPRGFDRLLSAGFSSAEVASLRTQFLAIQAHTHTPDQMPSSAELLALEERWLDNGSGSNMGSGQDGGGFSIEDTGGLDDMLYGNLIGFFWPIGAMCWLMREEGVWSRRRQIAVLSGILVNLMFGWLAVKY